MTDQTQTMDIEKQELTPTEETERTRDTRCFLPRADIYETNDQIVVVVDVPGADENSIDINLEKNVLTINAFVEPDFQEGYNLAFAEYEVGDYQRSFRLSNEIDREKIEATVKDGVLRLYLPKAAAAMNRRISVKGG
jgi:HSP20 family molecular chaperone IbpA